MYILCVYIYQILIHIFSVHITPSFSTVSATDLVVALFWWGFWEVRGDSLKLWRRWCAAPSRHSAEYQRTWWKMEICGHLKHQSVAMLLPPTFTKRKQLETTVMGGNYGFDQWSRQVSSNRIQWYPVPPSSELRRSSSAGFRDGITGFDLVYGAVAAPGKTYGNPFFQGLAPQWRPKIQ